MACILLQLLTYCILIVFCRGVPLIGQKVRDAGSDELRFVVSIARRSTDDSSFQNLQFCTGTLISRKSVLTARHCLINKTIDLVEVIAGSADVSLGERYYPKWWTTYDEWKNDAYNVNPFNDIAIITLDGEGVSNSKITPASVLTFDPTDLYKLKVRIAGWGISENGERPMILKTAVLTVISNDECNEKASKLLRKRFVLPEVYFCSLAEPWVVSSCGDSGAPILNKRNQLVGMNIGRCPSLEGYPQLFKNQNQLNSHLHMYHYREFIRHMKMC